MQQQASDRISVVLEFDYSAAGGNGIDVSFTDTDKLRAESHITVNPWQGGVQTGGERSLTVRSTATDSGARGNPSRAHG